MKKVAAVLLVFVFALTSLAACARGGVADAAASPAPSSAPAQQPISPEEAIAAATTPEELRALVAACQTAGDNDSACLAAKKLIALDPADTQAYQDAITALLGGISADYTEIQELVKLCLKNAPNGAADFAHWAAAQNQAFSFTVPFVSDYKSEDEINTVGISMGNMTNQDLLPVDFWRNGLLTSQGDWVYFMLPANDFYVYKAHPDGTGMTNVGDARGDNLNIVGDWLYYKNLNDADMPYRIRTDGTQKEGPLFNRSERLVVTQTDYIFKDNALFRSALDTSQKTTLLEGGCELMSYAGGWIYYCTGGNNSEFCRVSADGGEPQKLMDGWMYHYTMYDGWIYYIINSDLNTVQRMRPDGSEQSEVYRSEDMINAFEFTDGKLILSVCKGVDERGKPYPTDLTVVDPTTGDELFSKKAYVPTIYTGSGSAFYYDENYVWHALNLTTYAEGTLAVAATNPQPEQQAQTTPQGPSVVGNTSANLFMAFDEQNAGLLAGEGEQIFFGNPRDEMRLYAASKSGPASLKKLLGDSAVNINLADGTLYFRNKNHNYGIESIGIDGQNQKTLLNEPCDNLSYADGWLYCRMGEGIFRLPSEGGDPAEIHKGKFCNIYAAGGWVYYIEDNEGGGLWRVPADGGESQPLLTNHHALFYAIQDDLLYCLIDGGDSVDVIRMKLDGSEQKEVFSLKEKIHAINISSGRLIIVKDSDSGSGNMALVLDPDRYTVEMKIDGLPFPCVCCVGSDVYFFADDGFVRVNLDTGERTVIAK